MAAFEAMATVGTSYGRQKVVSEKRFDLPFIGSATFSRGAVPGGTAVRIRAHLEL